MADQNDLVAAIEAARSTPENEAAWDAVEELAGELDAPDPVAEAYREVIEGDLGSELVLSLGERAAQFHEEWYSDDPSGLIRVLSRMLEIDAESQSAFQRLTVTYTVAEKWDELLELYDRTIDAAADDARKIQLLDEASQVAKDVAGRPEQAIGYLQRLLPLRPTDKKLALHLQRLLEKHERWRDLIALWEQRLSHQKGSERLQTRTRIATCWMDRMSDPAQALEAVKPLLAEATDDSEATALLDRILRSEAEPDVRDGALALLRQHYGETEQPKEIVRVLGTAIERADGNRLRTLHEEAAERLADLGDDAAATEHFAQLLTLDPTSAIVQEQLRQMAQRSGNYEAYAQGVAAAADGCDDISRRISLLAEAARTRLDYLNDEAGAIDLLVRALDQEGISDGDIRVVSRRLGELLASADRGAERLGVLERLAAVENSASRRRAVLGEVARLGERLGETERALAAWNTRIASDPSDMIAVDSVVTLLEKAKLWEPLVEAINRRIQSTGDPRERESDLVRIATIYSGELNDTEKAIEAWLRVQNECGEDGETIDALTELFATAERWPEMAELLHRASGRETARVTDRLARLAEAQRAHLGAPGQAMEAFRQVLLIDSQHEIARAGLTELLDDGQLRAQAANALVHSYRANGEWDRFLSLVAPRLEQAADEPREQLRILREAAEIQETKTDDAAGALGSLAQAMPLSPRDRRLEDDVIRLARLTGNWTVAVQAYRNTAEAMSADPHEVAHLRFQEAMLLENEVDEPEAAYAAYLAVVGIEPDHGRAARAVTRIGGKTGQWDQVAAVFAAFTAARKTINPDLIESMVTDAREQDAWSHMVAALSAALERVELPPKIAFELTRRLGVWYRDELNDMEAAKACFGRALSFDSTEVDTLRDLATLQESTPDRAYYDSLMGLVDAEPNNLDYIARASTVAAEQLGDADLTRQTVTILLGRATAAWRAGAENSDTPPEELVSWSMNRLVDDHLASDRPTAAIDLLVDASRLPFAAETRRAFRIRAAEIATAAGDMNAAIEMYRAVLAMAVDSGAPREEQSSAIDRLAALYEQQERIAELLTLRNQELPLVEDSERKLKLRLEIARLVGEVERRGGRLEVLQANLEESPGHEDTIEALCALLDANAQYAALATMLEEQAQKLEAYEDSSCTTESESQSNARASGLWRRVAEVSRHQLEDLDRAIAAYRHSVALEPTYASFDALANLHLERELPGQAVQWLERCLAVVEPAKRADVVLQLANAHLAANQPVQAIAALEGNLSLPPESPADSATDAPPSDQDDAELAVASDLPLRALLANLLRDAEQWEPLARLLTRSLPLLNDSALVTQYATEASQIYAERLNAPDMAIPALESALAINPKSRELKLDLAIGLRVAGRLEEARTVLSELIVGFGRRKSAERAAVHVELALVAKEESSGAEALEQLELASKMDVGNPRILKMVADLYLVNDQPEDAEKQYRALLLLVRRRPASEDIGAVGSSEVLYELHKIAVARNDDEQATDLRESALEAASQSDAEVGRLRRSLEGHGDFDVLLTALKMRLEIAEVTESRAMLLTAIADVLDDKLHRSADALDAQLSAIDLIPDRIALHERARELAVKAGQVERYIECVDRTVDKLRRKKDSLLVATLLMEAGNTLERDAGDLARALSIYKRVENSGEREGEALFAVARVAGLQGDTEEETRALDALLELALGQGNEGDEPSPAQIDALYRMAEIFTQANQSEDRRNQGVDLLAQAFGKEPRFAQAGATLRTACLAEPENKKILALYEQVARGGGDWQMLLDFLERRANAEGASPADVKEAVDLAVEHNQRERGEALLERAVEAARASEEGIFAAVWAAVALASQRSKAGEFSSAKNLLFEIADLASPDRVIDLGLAIADSAAKAEDADPTLATEIYEFLREREPADRRIWEPLVTLYRTLGDRDQVRATISATLPNLVEPSERNALRMQHAAYLVDQDDAPAAIEVLRDLLLDDADHLEGAALLEQVLRDSGDQSGLADLLWQRFEDAKERRNSETITDVALRLGRLLEEINANESGAEDAASVYSQGLEIAPESPDLLRAVIGHLSEDTSTRARATLIERLLAATRGDDAVSLTDGLITIYEELEDDAGVQRALELGFRAAPAEGTIRQRLESWYRDRQLWRPLAQMMADDAERLEDQPELAVARLREGAEVYREMLSDPTSAASLLQRARALAPGHENVLRELVGSLCLAGKLPEAENVLSQSLDVEDLGDATRVVALHLRADLRGEQNELGPAVQDLEEANLLDRELTAPLLIAALERYRAACEATGESDGERGATLRLGELLLSSEQHDTARDLVTGWIQRHQGDRDALYFLRNLSTKIDDPAGIVTACVQLVTIESGAEQIDAALALADAAERAEQPDTALQGLEQVYRAQPESVVVRDKLRRIYELAGAYRELAGLLVADGEHSDDVDSRYASYRKAAEVYLLSLGDATAAMAPAEKARELKPDHHDSVTLYVDVLTGAGQIDDAVSVLEPAIAAHKRRSPDLASLQQRRARIAAAQGDQDGHLTWLKKAFDVDRKNGEIAAELAQLATELGDYDLALKPLRAITLMDDPQPITRQMALLWEAKIEHARGNQAKAELWAKKALREDPNYAEAEEFLQQISG